MSLISAEGDFAFSAESGTVWMYDQNWYNNVDIVQDQVTPARDANPQSDGSVTAEINTEYSRGDHVHSLNVTTTIPPSDSTSGPVGSTNYYARNDHSHPFNTSTSILPQDSESGSVGTTNYYARNDHSHPINVQTNASIIPIVNSVSANETSAFFYVRYDHVLPQQLTYDGNVTTTKFIKTRKTANDILLANGDTTTLDNKLSRTYTGSGWIRLCMFPAGASVGNPFIEFKVYTMQYAFQTFRLQPNYTVIGINTVYGIFTAPAKVSSYNDIDIGENQLFHNHSRSDTSALYQSYVRLESVGTITIVLFDKSTYYPNRITEILIQDIVSVVASGTQIPITYNLTEGCIINKMLQVNPNGRTYSTYNNDIRIENYSTEQSSIYLGCSNSAINTTQAGQWEMSETRDKALTINPSSLRQVDNSIGLSINGCSSIIKFNGNELVNVGTDQTITGKKTFDSLKKTNGTNQQILLAYGSITLLLFAQREYYIAGTTQYIKLCTFNTYTTPYDISNEFTCNYCGGQCFTNRIFQSPTQGNSVIYFGVDSSQNYGTQANQCAGTDNANRELVISTDGNSLSFNGRIL
ncbi:MAG: hypothetical protein EZS28_022742 [Streblomastix strix]|uniref:Uncharacterized protein n=1 Tax=Streblomastix strix TaxID=222440 RepID=A0A5J4VGR7_9EUKA|nr:MAG: hypothetical protein EZS28_022742 [Streblomastix strix]